MRRTFRFFLRLSCAAILASVHAAGPTEILSDASALFTPEGTDEVVIIRSAMVQTFVDYTPNFSLTGEQSVKTTGGSIVVLPHRLVNQGFQPLAFHVFCRNRDGGMFVPEALQLFVDRNRNGRIDPEESQLAETDSLSVAGHEDVELLVKVSVPASARSADSAAITVMAREISSDLQHLRVNLIEVQETAATIGLFVEKSVSQNEIEVGEAVEFTVRVKNISSVALTSVDVSDTLPPGFSYVRDSFRLAGVRRANPVLSSGRLIFNVGNLALGESVAFSYRSRVGAAALAGNGMSWVRAQARDITSNLASVRVRLRSSVFNSKAIIVGRVFVDTTGNGLLDSSEVGVPGVRLFMEDGTSAVTDADGRYSFYGLSARTHVVKIDATSLPTGARLAVTSNDQAGDSGSAFASLKSYELHRSNFALAATSPETLAEIESRRTALHRPGTEITREFSGRLTTDGLPLPVADPKALPSSGVVAPVETDPTFPTAFARPIPKTTPVEPVKSGPAAENFDALAGVTDNEFGFVTLRNGTILPGAQTDVWIKGPVGARFALAVNGAIIGDDQVGVKATVPDRNAEAWNFVGVNLTPGENRVRATLLDPFGNVRSSATIRLVAPGALAFLKITPPDTAIADGTTASFVKVELLDARGTPVTARTPLTLETTHGQWRVEDLDPATPGTQVFIEGGQQIFALVPPLDPGESSLAFSSGAVRNESAVTFAPNLRPLLAVGVIEGSINFGARGQGAIFPVGSRDAFEEELRGLSSNSRDGKLQSGGRAAFFLKGKVRGDALLTAAYDSDKAQRERLFRDIQPGEFYPVYGDASERSYDAQSTGRLYVRIDHQRSYALLGDFTTATISTGDATAPSLGNYQRSLTGAKEHYETDHVTANVWASQDSTRQFVAEVSGNGTSGPYEFGAASLLANSERIEILTRDRNQPSRIVESRTLARFFDYEFEPFTGRLLFKAPVASVDSDLNPISIRLTAESETSGEKFWVYGADAHVRVVPSLEFGGSFARDENLSDPSSLASADAAFKLSEHTKLLAEVARSETELSGEGWAGRVDLKHQDERLQGHVYFGKTEVAFRNAGALLLPGRVEGGFRFNYKLRPTTSVLAEGLITEALANGNKRQGLLLEGTQTLGAWHLSLGLRHSIETYSSGSDTVDSVRLKLRAPVPHVAAASTFVEYERDLLKPNRALAAAGFDYAFAKGGRAYARHEFITSLNGPFELGATQRRHTTVVGLERSYMKNGQFFNEYRADNPLAGREAEAALGLRNLWTIADGVRANTSFERVTPITGTSRNESIALTGSFDYSVDPRWRANARLELRTGTSTNSLLNTLGYARLLDRDWTFLGKSIVLATEFKGPNGGHTLQGRAQAGLAWRPAQSDRWNALGKYELKYETDSRATAAFSRRLTHLVSTDLNYQPSATWTFSGHYAGKWVGENTEAGRSDTFAHLVGKRASYAINRRWDVALNAHALFNGSFTQTRFAVGPEVGVVLRKNLNVGIGYNFVGFRDRDFAPDGSTARGAFLRMRFKFDENLFATR